jgi:hypothetical protein
MARRAGLVSGDAKAPCARLGQMTPDQLPGLTPERAEILSEDWDDGGLWQDVLWLGRQFCIATDPVEHASRWHHLVLAVGNCKRQGGRLRPCRLNELPDEKPGISACFETPAGLRVDRENRRSWEDLQRTMPGAGVATITALLAAIWPDQHFVFDRRVRAAANGLRFAAGLELCPGVKPSTMGGKMSPINFEDYSMVQTWLATIGCPLVIAERALYRLGQKAGSDSARSWTEYSKKLLATLEAI